MFEIKRYIRIFVGALILVWMRLRFDRGAFFFALPIGSEKENGDFAREFRLILFGYECHAWALDRLDGSDMPLRYFEHGWLPWRVARIEPASSFLQVFWLPPGQRTVLEALRRGEYEY